MENNYFSLEVNSSNKVIRIFQIIFGIICAALAVVWLIMNRDSLKSNSTLWFSIIFPLDLPGIRLTQVSEKEINSYRLIRHP